MREMKDSGIEWIGEIPVGWDLLPVKRFFRHTKRVVGSAVDEYERLALTMNGVIKRSKDDSEGLQPEKFEGYQILKENELVFKLIDLENVKTSRVGLSPYTGLVSPAYIVITNNKKDNRFYYYWFMFMYYNEIFNYLGGEGVRSALNAKDVLSLPVPAISDELMTNISTYLDTKCEKIDSIIARQQEVIEKLKAYKLSVITEAVTKGLNPDVRMKDSEVEWIGDVPEHWDTVRAKWLLNERKERSEYGAEEPLSMSQKYGLIPTKEMDTIPNMASTYVGAKIVYPDDLVFNKLKAHLGVFSVSKYCGLVSPDYAVYFSSGKANLKYLEYLFKTPQCILEFRKKSSGVAEGLTRLYTSGLFSIYCPFPPKTEQQQIADYLDKKCSAIDSAIAKKQAIIEKLTAYKKSLIYEVVTGKREVKGSDKSTDGAYAVFISPDVKSYAESLLFHKIINMAGKNLKGRTHLMKIFHAVELVIGFDFGTQYIRHIHGPYSDKIESLEKDLIDKGWLTVKKGKHIEYSVLDSSAYETDYNKYFKNYDSDIRNIVNCFLTMKRTSKAEKFATLLASWNDFIIDGVEPTDEMIINDVRTNWTENKANTDKETWQEILKQIKKANIIPRGYGKHTIRKDN